MTPAQARRQLAMRRWKREWYRRRYQTDAEFRLAENAKSRRAYQRRKERNDELKSTEHIDSTTGN